MGKLTISMAMFNNYVSQNQRVNHPAVGVHPLKPPAVLLIQLDPENGEDRSRLPFSGSCQVSRRSRGMELGMSWKVYIQWIG